MNNSQAWNRYLDLMNRRPECFQNTGSIHIVKDPAIVEAFQKRTKKTIGVCYESEFSILVVDLVYEQEGEYFAYERLLPAVPSGAVVCITRHQGKYILLKQYRHAMRDYQYAFPRGYATAGIDAEDNARKEAEEELGAKVTHSQLIGCVIADSGISGNKVEICLCDIEDYGARKNYEGIAETLAVTSGELIHMLRSNMINDGYTLAACSYLFASGIISIGP